MISLMLCDGGLVLARSDRHLLMAGLVLLTPVAERERDREREREGGGGKERGRERCSRVLAA